MKFVQQMMKPRTWCQAGKGIGIHAQVQGIAEKQNRICFHFEKLQNKKAPILLAFFAGYKFGPQMAPSVLILATSWCHLHQLKIGPPSDTTCIGSKVGHQVTTLADVANLTIMLRHIALTLSVSIELESSSARITSAKFQTSQDLRMLSLSIFIQRS